MVRLLVLKPGKEHIVCRHAIKKHRCGECKHTIAVGEDYIEDHINYARRKRGGQGYLWYHLHKVCFGCWRGPLPPVEPLFCAPSCEEAT